MAGVPAIMQAMLDEVAPKLEDRRQDAVGDDPRRRREGDVGTALGAIAKANPDVIIGSYPFFDEKLGPNTNIVVRSRDAGKARRGQGRGRRDARAGQVAAGGAAQHAADEHSTVTDGATSAAARPARKRSFPVSWDQFHRDSRALAWRLHEAGPFEAIVCHHARRAGAGGDRGARAQRAHDRDGLRRELSGLQEPGRAARCSRASRRRSSRCARKGKGVLIVDDLVDTGKTARVVRELLAGGAFRHRLCQAAWGGRWSTPSSPRCRRTPGSISPGTPGSPSSRRSARAGIERRGRARMMPATNIE